MAFLKPRFSRTIKIVGSDVLDAVQYDPSTQILDAQLKNGQRYRYRDVWGGTFARLVTSASPGKIYNLEIKKYLGGDERKATKLRGPRASHTSHK